MKRVEQSLGRKVAANYKSGIAEGIGIKGSYESKPDGNSRESL